MFVERTRTVAASADAGIVGSQVRIEIQIVTRHCRCVDQRWYLMMLEPRRFVLPNFGAFPNCRPLGLAYS
jgi:hypothetical protein